MEVNINSIKGRGVFEYLLKETSTSVHPTLGDFISKQADDLGPEQAFYTIDLGDILWKAQLWKESFPDINVFYAVKANSDPEIIRLCVLLGFGFDCSTVGEIKATLSKGVDPHKIIFAHTVKIPSGLQYAASVGVDLMTFDSEEELLKISKYFPQSRLVLRLKPNISRRQEYDLRKKFGCSVSEIYRLLQKAKDLELNFVGVSFHAGALCEEATIYTSSIHNCKIVFDHARKLGYEPYIVDIGAGFHGSHIKEKFFRNLSKKIQSSLQLNFPQDIRKIAEPGTYFVSSAASLVTTVIGKKRYFSDMFNSDDEVTDIEVAYYINEGFYGSFFLHWELYDSFPELMVTEAELNNRPVLTSKLWGQTCCSEDVVVEKLLLPEMEVGELLVWRNVGAYNKMVCSTFTEVPIPATKHIFIDNPRLDLSKIMNAEEVLKFLSGTAILVEQDSFLRESKQNGQNGLSGSH